MISDARQSIRISLLVAAAFFMENLDGTVIATALPQIAESFHARAVDLNIGMSAYLLTLAVLIPVSGWVADRFGARTVFGTAIAIFTMASLLCGLCQNLPEFVAARVLQGVGGALAVPVGRLVVLRNTAKEDLITAIAYLTWPALVAPVLGPALGGLITTYVSWRWIFILNLPLGIAGFLLTFRIIPQQRQERANPFDWTGFVLSGMACAGLLLSFELVARPSPDWFSLGLLAAASLAAGFGAVRHLLRHAHPLIDLRTLQVQTFRVTVWGGSLFRLSIGAIPFLTPLLFQLGFGLDPFRAGLLVLVVFAGNIAMKPGTTWVLRHFGFRRVLIGVGLISAASILGCAFISPATSYLLIVPLLFIGGMARSMQFTALNTIAFADMPKEKMSAANTLNSTAQQLSMGMGITAGALALRLGELVAQDSTQPSMLAFRIAFVTIAVIGVLAIADCLKLPRGAGESLITRKQA